MTTPSEPENGEPREGVNLGKDEADQEAPFDPYRFGKPDHPIPAEYAPPGYTGPVDPPASPYGQPIPWAPPGSQPGNPFNNPPGTPYAGQPSPYGYPGSYGPTPPPYHGYAQPKAGSGKAVAGLVLGIASIVFCFLSFFDGILVILGLIFSLIAMGETKTPGTSGRGMAIAGLICAIVGAVLATLFGVLIIHAINQCGGFHSRTDPGFNNCVQHHFG